MTQMVTRCPKCATAFRITNSQLESAKGSVRCGSCLHIFKAKDYFLSDAAVDKPLKITEPSTQSTSSGAPITQASSSTSNKIFIDRNNALKDEDDALISDDMENIDNDPSSYDSESVIEINLQPKQSSTLFEREIRYELPEEKKYIDESWADQLLTNEQEIPKPLKTHKKTSKNAQPLETTIQATAETHDSDNRKVPHFDAPIFNLINDDVTIENDSELSDAFVQATNSSPHQNDSAQQSASFAASLFTEGEENNVSQPAKHPLKSQPKIRASNSSRAALLMNIMPAPIEFTARKMRRWYQEKIWPSLAFVSAAALFFQVAYFDFDYFSRVEPYRTAYVFACPIVGCKVPNLVDKTQIVATNLIVHNNSNIKNSLIVDAIIINKAPFEQPFPDLMLVFTTLDDALVASRSFSPQEYLAGELVGVTHIPSNQPIHISLEIVDPGSDAVNYHMGIAQ